MSDLKLLALLCEIASEPQLVETSTVKSRGRTGKVEFGYDKGGAWVMIDGKQESLDVAKEYIGSLLAAIQGARQMEWAIERGFRNQEGSMA